MEARREGSAVTDAEADRIAVFSRMVAIHTELRAIAKADPWAPDRGPLHARYGALHAELGALEERAWDEDMVPETLAGARALGQAAWIDAPRDPDGEPLCTDFGKWMMLAAVKWLAGASAARWEAVS